MGIEGSEAEIGLRGGVALSRAVLDASIADQAQQAGVVFRDGASAALLASDDTRHRLALRSTDEHTEIEARVLLVADGVNGRSA